MDEAIKKICICGHGIVLALVDYCGPARRTRRARKFSGWPCTLCLLLVCLKEGGGEEGKGGMAFTGGGGQKGKP